MGKVIFHSASSTVPIMYSAHIFKFHLCLLPEILHIVKVAKPEVFRLHQDFVFLFVSLIMPVAFWYSQGILIGNTMASLNY